SISMEITGPTFCVNGSPVFPASTAPALMTNSEPAVIVTGAPWQRSKSTMPVEGPAPPGIPKVDPLVTVPFQLVRPVPLIVHIDEEGTGAAAVETVAPSIVTAPAPNSLNSKLP